MLKPLLLPQLVQERRQQQTVMNGEMNISQGSDIHDASSTQSPITPTFSTRGHVRYSSSVSSVDPLQSPQIEVPSSPAVTAKRPLPDVQEEPVEAVEREEHFETFDDRYDVYDWSCKSIHLSSIHLRISNKTQGDDTSYPSYTDTPAKSSVQISAHSSLESSYDLSDGFITSPTIAPATVGVSADVAASPRTGRKRAHSDSPFAGIADRISGLSSSLSRKWRTRKSSNPLGMSPLVTSPLVTSSNSRAPSTRSSSISNSLSGSQTLTQSQTQTQAGAMTGVIYTDREPAATPAHIALPPTPAISEFATRHGEHSGSTSQRESYASGLAPENEDERVKAFATTPLLPPLLMGGNHIPDSDIPLQSPLQCPSVASVADTLPQPMTASAVSGSMSGFNSPMLGHGHSVSASHSLAATPALLPSPPLSTRPSFSSMPTLTMTSVSTAPSSFANTAQREAQSPTYPLSHTTHPSALLAQLTTSIASASSALTSAPATSVPLPASATASVIAPPSTVLSPTESAPVSATIPFPPLDLGAPEDKWSLLLGHANFTISPSPYTLPAEGAELSLAALKQLREDWEEARTGFLRHLVRTGEHYGERSEVYKLSEKKWSEIDSEWSAAFSSAVAALAAQLSLSEDEVKTRVGGGGSEEQESKWECPVLDNLEGKWPKRGDEDIVGPMVREDVLVLDGVLAEGAEGRTMSRRNSTKEKVKGFFKGIVGRN